MSGPTIEASGGAAGEPKAPEARRFRARAVCDPDAPTGRIVATIGAPDSPGYADLEDIVGFGTIRLNLAFVEPQTYGDYRRLVRRIRERRGDAIGILLDCVGPRVKLGKLPREGVALREGAEVTLTTREGTEAGPDVLPSALAELARLVRPGQPVVLDEGRMRLEVLRVEGATDVRCVVRRGGRLKKRGLNLPETDVPLPALSDRDRRDLAALLEEDAVDMVALSFVRGPEDVAELRAFLRERRRPDVRIMAKIETRQAVEAIDDIAAVSDALMVARGDLWAELRNPWELPRITSRLIRAGNALGIPVVTATQTLSSMVDRDVPSRAEVDEVYLLLGSGSDAIMGSEEFAVGRHPREVAAAIRAVSREVDRERLEAARDGRPPERAAAATGEFGREKAAVAWAESAARVRCLVAISDFGKVARQVCRERPRKPLVVATNVPATARYLQLLGVYPVLVDYRWDDEDHAAIARAALEALGWRGADETAIVAVSHHAAPGRRYSKVEEVPLPR